MLGTTHCPDSRFTDGVRLLAARTGCALLPRILLFLSLIVIYVRPWVNHWGLVRQEGLHKLIEGNWVVGSRNRDPPAWSIAPQPALPPSPYKLFWSESSRSPPHDGLMLGMGQALSGAVPCEWSSVENARSATQHRGWSCSVNGLGISRQYVQQRSLVHSSCVHWLNRHTLY